MTIGLTTNLLELEIQVCYLSYRIIEFFLNTHDPHGIQSVDKRQLPTIEARMCQNEAHGDELETHLFTAPFDTGFSSSLFPAYF